MGVWAWREELGCLQKDSREIHVGTRRLYSLVAVVTHATCGCVNLTKPFELDASKRPVSVCVGYTSVNVRRVACLRQSFM